MHGKSYKFFCYINKFDTNFISKLSNNISLIYRNYDEKNDYGVITQIKKQCRKQKIKFYLSNNIKLALKLNLDGVYIPSFNKDIRHNSYQLKKKFTLLGSAHNLKEIRQKETQNVKCIFISPIFLTKDNKDGLGLYKFTNLAKYTKKKVACLGGISIKNIKIISMLKVDAIAGISFFND
tara:strand:- start:135 stop:671 length:537 start_codon:yes stop_codon:yes gene_type:complete